MGVARALIADPDLPLKVLTGRAQEVRPCVACNEDCRTFEPTLLCTVNPDLAPPGQPSRPAEPLIVGARAPAPARRVGVVGAGPAGLECALTLARAGDCEVVVWERETDVGGALAVAAGAPHRQGWLALLDYYRAELRAAGVTLRLGVEATADDLHECDAVVVACGAEEVLPVVGDAGYASSSSEALAAGPERLRGAAHLVVVDDGFGWWPVRQRRGAGRRRGRRADHVAHSRRRLRHGHPGREPDPAHPAARGRQARHPPPDLARGRRGRRGRAAAGRRRSSRARRGRRGHRRRRTAPARLGPARRRPSGRHRHRRRDRAAPGLARHRRGPRRSPRPAFRRR